MDLLSGPAQPILVKAESENTESVKTCTGCGKAKPLKSFHKNRSKALGVESACKVCVGRQKRRIRQAAKKKRLSTASFTSTVVGELGEDAEKNFAESFSEIVKDLKYDKKI